MAEGKTKETGLKVLERGAREEIVIDAVRDLGIGQGLSVVYSDSSDAERVDFKVKNSVSGQGREYDFSREELKFGDYVYRVWRTG